MSNFVRVRVPPSHQKNWQMRQRLRLCSTQRPSEEIKQFTKFSFAVIFGPLNVIYERWNKMLLRVSQQTKNNLVSQQTKREINDKFKF